MRTRGPCVCFSSCDRFSCVARSLAIRRRVGRRFTQEVAMSKAVTAGATGKGIAVHRECLCGG
jgi:hypothetical protein